MYANVITKLPLPNTLVDLSEHEMTSRTRSSARASSFARNRIQGFKVHN